MDPSTIAGLASSLSSAATLSKTLLGMKIDSEVRDAITALQSELISAQSAALTSLSERDEMYRKIQELEEALSEKTDWIETASKFETFETRKAFAYRAKEGSPEGLYCPKCFENKGLSRLQEDHWKNGAHYGTCLQCDVRLEFDKGTTPRSRVASF